MRLGFGRSTFRFAGPQGRFGDDVDQHGDLATQLAGTRIATSYVGVVRAFLEERGIEATVVRLDGAVESSIQLGVADVVADVVETGSTLRQAGLDGLRRADPGVGGGAHHPGRRRPARPGSRSSSGGSRASWWPAAT